MKLTGIFCIFLMIGILSCSGNGKSSLKRNQLSGTDESYILISKEQYKDRLAGFWLGQCIGNWTGLVTEMDKIGNIGEIKTGAFYTRDDWGKADQPSIWGEGMPSDLSPVIDFVFRDTNEIWGADDDTDIEYMYQEMLYRSDDLILSPEQIRDGWLHHIRAEEENYLWVSNQKAYDLMKSGILPPATGDPENNEHFEMIDAQLTTEIFGIFAPARPEIALSLASLPIQTTARRNAEYIARFYITMFSLAVTVDPASSIGDQLRSNADIAKAVLPDYSYAADMYDFTRELFESGYSWEETRDSIYSRYQIEQAAGYELSSRNLYCNACFAAGINFAASLVSLFYGDGDLKETIRIGTLAGWDSDNPTATWGGLIGFIIGRSGIEAVFNRKFSDRYHIHRTRQNFPNDGIDTFEQMALKGVNITERVILELIGGSVDADGRMWKIENK